VHTDLATSAAVPAIAVKNVTAEPIMNAVNPPRSSSKAYVSESGGTGIIVPADSIVCGCRCRWL
jgi:hypothetical protein